MKRITVFVAAVALTAAANTFAYTQKASSASQSHNLYVVADVLPSGEVAAVHPYERLSPELTNLLRKTVASWITGPAIVDGRRSYARVLFHVVLRTEPMAQGQYSAKFNYLSAENYQPVNTAVRSRFPGASWNSVSTNPSSPGTLVALSNSGIIPTRP